MKEVSGKRLARALEKRGWALLRIAGSHHIYGRDRIDCPTVGAHSRRKALKTGLLRHLMKLAELTEADL